LNYIFVNIRLYLNVKYILAQKIILPETILFYSRGGQYHNFKNVPEEERTRKNYMVRT